jgi:hypothetical protein
MSNGTDTMLAWQMMLSMFELLILRGWSLYQTTDCSAKAADASSFYFVVRKVVITCVCIACDAKKVIIVQLLCSRICSLCLS